MIRRLLVLVILLAVPLAVALFILWSPGIPVQVARAEYGSIEEYVDEQGKTRLPQTYTITMPFSGRLEAISLQERDPVTQGTVVARISTADVTDARAAALAAVQRVDASIARNDDDDVEQLSKRQADRLVESMDKVVQASSSRVTAGKERLVKSEIFLKRVREMMAKGGATKTELDQAELDYVESNANHRQSLLISESMKAMQAATLLLPGLVAEQIANKELTHAVLEKEREEAAARLREVETRIQRSEMRSPVDGIVLNRIVRDEQFLPASAPLLRIGQLTELEVETDVLSRDAFRVRPGNAVGIYGPGVGRSLANAIPGTVTRIHPAGVTKISSLGIEQQRVKVIVRFDRDDPHVVQLLADQQLGAGYRVRVRIVSKRKEKSLVIPRTALFRGDQNHWQLFAVRDGKTQIQEVALGIENDDWVEIAAGLQEGESVVLNPENNLTTGVRVVPESGGTSVDQRRPRASS